MMVGQRSAESRRLPGAPPKQVERVQRYLDRYKPDWRDSGEWAVDVLLGLHRKEVDTVRRAAEAMARCADLSKTPPDSAVEEWRLYRWCGRLVNAIQVGDYYFHDSAALIDEWLVGTRYEVIDRSWVLVIHDRQTGADLWAFSGDWIVVERDGTLAVVTGDNFAGAWRP